MATEGRLARHLRIMSGSEVNTLDIWILSNSSILHLHMDPSLLDFPTVVIFV